MKLSILRNQSMMVLTNDKENDTSSSVVKATTISRFLLQLTRSITNFTMVKPMHQNRLKQKFIKISTKNGGSTMKVFGDELNPSIAYKTFLLSVKDTAEWIVKEMLVKYGLKHANARDYCLIQITISFEKEMVKEVILHDKDCPLNIYLNHLHQNQESIVFKVRKCSPTDMQIRQQLHPNDRILSNHQPLLIEVNPDGTNLSTPRVFQLHPNTTYIGRHVKTDIESQYIYIDADGIHADHCTIENRNRSMTVIPRGETWYNGKLLSKPFLLQHGALICFGRSTTFRYFDPKTKSILKQTNENKLSTYTSLPLLPKNELEKNQRRKFNILPGLLEVPSEYETKFLQVVFDNYPLMDIRFRLIPVYTLYMLLRHRLSPFGKANRSAMQKQEDVLALLYRIEHMIDQKIEECQDRVGYLSYWLANTSELVDFLKQDRELATISSDIQFRLIRHIHQLVSYLLNRLQTELDKHLILFLNLRDISSSNDHLQLTEIRWMTSTEHQPQSPDLLAFLTSLIDLFRKCRVNPGLTIGIFSQLFHYINAWLFNRMVCSPELKLCSQFWAKRISHQLKSLQNWAFQQGLEIPSEYHLMKINQLCSLLQSEKGDLYDVQQLVSNNKIFLINSIQINEILKNYILEKNEPPITTNFSQALLSFVYKYVDEELYRQGWGLRLSEDGNLDIPFSFPDDGYSWESLRGIPEQLFGFIEPINGLGFCRLFTNSFSLGLWTQFMQISKKENRNEQIETIVLNKRNNTLGMNIVSAKNESQQIRGIYIKGIIPGSVADENGKLQSGDQILSVDQISLLNATQEQATEILRQCERTVILRVLKNAANQHGLSALFSSSSLNETPSTRPIVTRTQSLTPPQISLQTNEFHDESSDDFDEKLKRRLEQFEHEREIERARLHRISTQRQAEIEARLQNDREREIRPDNDLKQFHLQRMSPEDRLVEAKKERARLLKHVRFSSRQLRREKSK